MTYTSETRSLYYSEVANNLRREGFEVEKLDEEHLAVSLDAQPICEVSSIGGITYRSENLVAADLESEKDRAFEVVRSTAEYVRQIQTAQPLKVKDLSGNYKVLADFNGTVLAASETRYGVQFVTWDWDFDRKGVSHGHYFNGSYEAAKEDFATRSGLLSQNRVFSEAQMAEIYRCCRDVQESEYSLSPNEEKIIGGIREKIESQLPDIADQPYHEQTMDMQSM